MDRRAFITASASAAVLAGCASVPQPRLAVPCLPKVRVDPARIIRTTAGLRPYRESGFVVRGEAFGEKRLVHNYGHGGAGITLSWGSSKLATDIGLPGHSGPVAVIGAGVMGLTVARLVQEAGFPVTIYTRDMPRQTTSAVSGGQISPHAYYRRSQVTAEWRAQNALAINESWKRFNALAGEEYGVRWLPTYEHSGGYQRSLANPYEVGTELLGEREHSFPYGRVMRWSTMYVEMGRYLDRMEADVREAGGQIEQRAFNEPADVMALSEGVVFNCSGIGARALFGDAELVPVRGQLAWLEPQPEIQYAYAFRDGYMFPRPDGVLLGGTFEEGQWDATPQPGDISRILSGHQEIAREWPC